MYHLPQLQYIREHWGFLCFNNNNNKNIKIMCYWVNLNNNRLNTTIYFWTFDFLSFPVLLMVVFWNWSKGGRKCGLIIHLLYAKTLQVLQQEKTGSSWHVCYAILLGTKVKNKKLVHTLLQREPKLNWAPGHCVCLTNLFPVRENHQNINKNVKIFRNRFGIISHQHNHVTIKLFLPHCSWVLQGIKKPLVGL